ncbi:MAG TPA: MMPL family transporter [Gammaproteobacteria bacterium]|nr:MMPL family transporter [Gammaproteobacteria bacterium]
MTAGDRIVGCIWHWRWPLVLMCIALTLAACWQAARIGVDNSLEIWFVEDDPALVSYRRFQGVYGNDESVVIAFHEPEGIVTSHGLALLERARLALETVEGVASIDSILDVPGTRIGDASAHARILNDPALVDRLVSRDGDTALLIVRMAKLEDMDRKRDLILANIDKALTPLRAPYHKAGFGVLFAALNELSIVDGFKLFCAATGVIFFLLILFYRRIFPALVTLSIAFAAAAWTMGIYAAAGRSLNIVTSILPTLVLVVTTAGCVHVLLHVAETRASAGRETKVIHGVGFMFRPCLMNTLTTAAGLLSLTASSLPVVRELGLFGAAGLIGALVLTMIGCVFALAWEAAEPAPGRTSTLRQVASRLADLSIRNSTAVLASGALVLAFFIAAATRVDVDTYTIDFLFEDHPVRRDSAFIESRIAPYTPLEFEVRTSGGVPRLDLLQAVDRWQRAAGRIPGIGWSQSYVDVVKRIRQFEMGGEQSAFELPQSQTELDALLVKMRALSETALTSTLFDNRNGLRVTFGVPMQSARSLERTIRAVESAASFPSGVVAAPAGYLPLYVRMTTDIVRSQLWSFALAFLTVFGVIGILFRSARVAALAIPANLIPVVFILGIMGLAGIRLDVATVTIAAVVLGIVVDDTVHFLHRLCHECRRSDSHAKAVCTTARTAGYAIVTTTVVLALGFSVFGLAEIKSIIWFGLLMAVGLAAGVIADLLLMPALIVGLKPRLGNARRASGPRDGPGPAAAGLAGITEGRYAK